MADLPAEARAGLSKQARKTARRMSLDVSANRLLSVYNSVIERKAAWDLPEDGLWQGAMRRIAMEWKLFGTIAHAAGTALVGAETLEGNPT
jgi:hypothetical protein